MIIQETLSCGLQLSITRSCHALEVSRNGYFKQQNQPGAISLGISGNKDLRDQIQEIALEFSWLWIPKDNNPTPEPRIYG
jgi:putative transposase